MKNPSQPLSNGTGINKNVGISNSSYNLSHHELGETAVYFRDAAKGIGLIKEIDLIQQLLM